MLSGALRVGIITDGITGPESLGQQRHQAALLIEGADRSRDDAMGYTHRHVDAACQLITNQSQHARRKTALPGQITFTGRHEAQEFKMVSEVGSLFQSRV